MKVTATEFRKNLFKLLERTLDGEVLEVVYKGSSLHVAANGGQSKLGRVKRQHSLIGRPNTIVRSDKKLMKKLEAEWRTEWRNM